MSPALNRARVLAIQEAGLHLRGPLVWLLLALALLASTAINPASFVASGGPAADGTPAFVTSMHAMAQVFSLGGFLVYVFFASIMAGNAVIRDEESRVSDLLHATPLRPVEYVAGRLGGVMLSLFVVLAVHTLCVLAWYQFLPIPDLDGQRGPFLASNYLIPSLAFAAPALWASTCLAFAVGERTRRPMAVYAVPITLLTSVLFFLWTWSPPGLSPGLNNLLMILDPSGLRWMRETVYGVHKGVRFYNENPIGFDVVFGLRVLFWTLVPAMAVLASVSHVRKAIRGAGSAKKSRPVQKTTERSTVTGSLDALGMSASPPGFFRSVLLILRAELRELRAQPILLLALPLTVLMVLEFATATDASGAPLLLTAGGMAVSGLDILSVLLCLLLLFATTEALHREQRADLQGIYFATPFPSGAYLLAKNLASGVLILVLVLVCVLLSVGQLAAQGGPVAWTPFAVVWGAVLLPTLLFWAALVTLVYCLARNRAVTYGVSLLLLVGTLFLFSSDRVTWATNWPLWGTLRWSDMGLFGLNGHALLANRMLALLVALLFAQATAVVFSRGQRRDAIKGRRRWLPLLPTLALCVLLGGWMSLKVQSGFQGGRVTEWERAYREAAYTWRQTPLLTLRRMDITGQLAPADRSLTLDGTFELVNEGDEAVSELPLTLGPGFSPVSWRLDQETVADVLRERWLDIVRLPQPLAPGDSVRLGFEYVLESPAGWTRNGGGIGHFILPSGVLVSTLRGDFLPRLGVDPSRGLDAEDGTEGEPEAVNTPPPFHARLAISAPTDFTVTSAGRLMDYTESQGVGTAVWETDHPVRAINLMAGRWKAAKAESNTVYYHGGHDRNVDEILEAVTQARAWYGEWFGTYPWAELRINEFPALETNATSFPTNISFSEGIGFLTQPTADARLAFSVTAHEVAHQWWGNLIAVDQAPGSGVLVEGMANFATLLLHERVNGPRARMAYARWLEDGFVRSRRPDSEIPLMENRDRSARDQAATSAKGAWALWMLSGAMGTETMTRGLREFADRYRDSPISPTLPGLLETLKRVAPDSLAFDQVASTAFRGTALPEFRINGASRTLAEGRWTVRATVENRGNVGWTVDVAVSSGLRWSEDYVESRKGIWLAPGQAETLEWVVDLEPDVIIVDPDVHVLQVNRSKAMHQF